MKDRTIGYMIFSDSKYPIRKHLNYYFKFRIGKIYDINDLKINENAFYFCKEFKTCFRYAYSNYFEDPNVKIHICKIKALGDIEINDDGFYYTNKIKILEEIKNAREISNNDYSSTGFCNTGSHNTGNYNTGHFNSGNFNIGSHNIGMCNNGHYNVGKCNAGLYNTGNFNTGSFNTGDFNYGDYNTGIFNSNHNRKKYIKIFDEESNWTFDDWRKSFAYKVLESYPHICTYYDSEKDEYINRVASDKEKQEWWDNLSDSEKDYIKKIPNFNYLKFYACTGILTEKDESALNIYHRNQSINCLPLSKRTLNQLHLNGICTINELLSFSENELLKKRGIGLKALNEIKSIFEKFNNLDKKDD